MIQPLLQWVPIRPTCSEVGGAQGDVGRGSRGVEDLLAGEGVGDEAAEIGRVGAPGRGPGVRRHRRVHPVGAAPERPEETAHRHDDRREYRQTMPGDAGDVIGREVIEMPVCDEDHRGLRRLRRDLPRVDVDLRRSVLDPERRVGQPGRGLHGPFYGQ